MVNLFHSNFKLSINIIIKILVYLLVSYKYSFPFLSIWCWLLETSFIDPLYKMRFNINYLTMGLIDLQVIPTLYFFYLLIQPDFIYQLALSAGNHDNPNIRIVFIIIELLIINHLNEIEFF